MPEAFLAKWKSHLVQLINLPLLTQAVLLFFLGRIISTNTTLVFHGIESSTCKELDALVSSSHPIALRVDNTTHLLCIIFTRDQVWGIYLHEIAEVQDGQCPESGCCTASCAHVISEVRGLYNHTPVPKLCIPKTEGTKIGKQRK